MRQARSTTRSATVTLPANLKHLARPMHEKSKELLLNCAWIELGNVKHKVETNFVMAGYLRGRKTSQLRHLLSTIC
jgi:hypothetical protein